MILSTEQNTINQMRLRCLLGWLSLLLPWIQVILLHYFPGSISITYFSYAFAPFMIILGASAILLICYKGYDIVDDIINTAAGIFGLLICMFPCNPQYDCLCVIGPFQIDPVVSNIIHCISAGIFFALLSFNSLFRFTKSSGEMTPNKKKRNIIYRVCGIGMLLSFTLFFVPDFSSKIWLIETIALFFFGISFLTKADRYWWLFADVPSDLSIKLIQRIRSKKS